MKNTILEKLDKSVLRFLQPLTINETNEAIVHEGIKLVGAVSGSLILDQGNELIEAYTTLPFQIQRPA